MEDCNVKHLLRTLTNLHVLDISVCGAVIAAGFAVACKAIADVNPFWGMLAMLLGAAMLFCVIGEEYTSLNSSKPQMLRPRSVLDLPRNTRTH